MNIAIIFGGESGEHDVSLMSASSVASNIDQIKNDIFLILVDKKGCWWQIDKIVQSNSGKKNLCQVSFIPGSGGLLLITDHNQKQKKIKIDVVFPLIHGGKGENGSLQGYLEIIGVPYVGCKVLSSAVGMDKDIAKRLLLQSGVGVVEYLLLRRGEKIDYKQIIKLCWPLFVKPSSTGSSVGVSKVRDKSELVQALQNAFRFDNKVMIEKTVVGREIECSVIGNNQPIVSRVGEIKTNRDFYDYKAKYGDDNTALIVPALIENSIEKKIQKLAKKVYKTLECTGLARVDFFVNNKGEILVNEINTVPGFTEFSMYPKMWEASGVGYNKLIKCLLALALDNVK